MKIAMIGKDAELAAKKFYADQEKARFVEPKWKDPLIPKSADNNRYDVLFANFTLCRVAHFRVVDTIRNWRKVLKPEGVLHITVPSAEWFADQIRPPGQQSQFAWEHLFGVQTDPQSIYLTGFTMLRLRMAVTQAGFFVFYARSYGYNMLYKGSEYAAELHHVTGTRDPTVQKTDAEKLKESSQLIKKKA